MNEHHREGRTGLIQPLGYEGVQRRHDGILCYADRPESLVEMLRASAERFPRKNAIVEVGGQTLTYAELWERAASIAGGLRRSGVTPGDRVAVRYGNGIRWCLAFFGSLLAGAVVVPVNTRLAEREAQYILEDADVSYVFEGVRDLPCGHPFAHEAARSDIAALFYTSGTTGFPKGAITTHENFLATSETFQRQAGRPDPGIRHLISIPLFHVTGCNSQLIPTLEMGGTSIVLRTFSTEAFISAVREFRVDFLVSVPSVYWLVMEHPEFHSFDRSTVRFLACGGAPTPPALISKIAKAFPQARLVNGYGLTETAATSTSLPHEYIQSRPDSVGLAIPIVELDLADVDAMSGIGELLIRGQNVTSGYWRNSLATDAAFVNGWFHTGDLARIDTDGFVTLVDRKKDMINRGGENVYCIEVENAVAAHPSVYESAVLSVPDEMLGERVGVVVVVKRDMTLEPIELRSYLADYLADFKIPEFIIIQKESLPRNPGGKVVKSLLRKETSWNSRRP